MTGLVPRVWAPAAGRLDLVVGADRRPMRAESGGWWTHDVPLASGTDYAYSLDGGTPRPDPRSGRQPHGVHAASQVFDADEFAWTDAAWPGRDVRGAVFYELHVGTFTPEGTLRSAIARLDHLAELGVEVVELMPVAAFDGRRGWGYDGVALYAVHEPYGGPRALQALVDAAHARGLAVCLDVVHNHLGPSGNYLAEFGPYFTEVHTTPWGAAVNLDQPGSPEVRRWICDNALHWFADFHIDALRLDAVHALADESPRHLLAQLSEETRALADRLGRPLGLIAESDLNDVVTLAAPATGGWGMTAQWADDVHHAVHALVTGERHGYYADFGSPEVLAHAMERVFVPDGGWSAFRQQVWGRPVPPGTDGHRFVVFDQDHDQVGNRALGDRPSSRLDNGLLAVEAALILTSPFTPMLFMGEEWGARTPWLYFTDQPDPELGAAIREGRRAEFSGHDWAGLYGGDVEVPDPQDPATFERSRLDWSEPDQPEHARLLAWYQRLVAVRRQVPDLASGDLAATALRYAQVPQPAAPAQGGSPADRARWRGWLVLERGTARVAVNLADVDCEVPVPAEPGTQVLAAWRTAPLAGAGADLRVRLPAHSVAVLARATRPRGRHVGRADAD